MDESTKPKISNKIVFLSRAETYFGRILAQHLSHAVIPEPNLNEAKTVQKDELLDLSFLDTAAEFGSFKVFGTWCPVEPSSPYEASKRPPRITAIQGMCPSDNYADIAKMVSAADICIFNLVDDDGHNDVYEDTIKAFGITKQVWPKHFKSSGYQKLGKTMLSARIFEVHGTFLLLPARGGPVRFRSL